MNSEIISKIIHTNIRLFWIQSSVFQNDVFLKNQVSLLSFKNQKSNQKFLQY